MNQHPFWWSSIQQGITPTDFINVVPNTYTFSYESGDDYTFQISGTTGYTITTGASWLSIDSTGGTSGITYVTAITKFTNSGTTDWVEPQGIIVTGIGLPAVYVSITQTFEPQPLLYIMTEGGEFEGELV